MKSSILARLIAGIFARGLALAVASVPVMVPVNANVTTPGTRDLDGAQPGSSGTVPAAVSSYVVATEKSDTAGIDHQTTLTITNLPITMRDTQQGGGAKVYSFPIGRIARFGACGQLSMTTKSILANTLNTGVTCNWGVGSTTQANATLATTEQDIINVTAWTAGTTIDVANAATNGVGPGVLAALDGHTTSIDAFLNLAVAGATDIDADATIWVNGTIVINWSNIGPY